MPSTLLLAVSRSCTWQVATLCVKNGTYSYAARAGLGKPNQYSTPIRQEISRPDVVTIVDPRHPLYGQTFPLLHIKHQQNLILSCVVQVLPDASRLVPVDVTDLAATEPDVFPTPLALSSLHDLTQTFGHILAQVTTERCDDTNQDVRGHRGAAATGLADPQPHATAAVTEDGGARLPADGHGTDGGGEQ